MPFQKGKSGNPAGRAKGTQNQSTDELRNVFRKFLAKNTKQLQRDFDKLEPWQRLQFIEKVGKFVLPPLSTEGSDPLEGRKIFTVMLTDDDGNTEPISPIPEHSEK